MTALALCVPMKPPDIPEILELVKELRESIYFVVRGNPFVTGIAVLVLFLAIMGHFMQPTISDLARRIDKLEREARPK